MTKWFRGQVEHSLRLKWILNGWYVYSMQLMYMVLAVCPPIIRHLCFKLILARMGANVFVDYKVYFKYPRLTGFGSDVSVNRGCEFYADYFGKHGIWVGSNVRIGPNVRFHAAGHDTTDDSYAHNGADIIVEDGVWIGASVVILQGVRIGEKSIVAAGSVVTRDVPSATLVGGVPAKEIRRLK